MKIIFSILISIPLFAQHIKVVENNGEPIPLVRIISFGKNTITNSDGFVNLSKFTEDEFLNFTHLNYRDTTIQKKDLSKTVELEAKDIKIQEVVVFGQNSQTKFSKNISTSDKISIKGIDNLINNNTSFQVNKYGGENSLSTISFRSLGSENTLILFNEARVNDLRSGSFDFSQIETRTIDEITITEGNDNGFTSAGGIIKLNANSLTLKNSLYISGGLDSENGKSFNTRGNYSFGAVSMYFNFSRSFSPNKFNYIFDSKEYERKNADYSKTFISTGLNYIDESKFLKLYFHYSQLNSGLPGYIVTNNLSSSKVKNASNVFLGTLNFINKFSKTFTSEIHSNYSMQSLNLKDPMERILINRFEENALLTDFTIQNRNSINLSNLNLNFGGLFSLGYLENTSPIKLTYLDNIYQNNRDEITGYIKPKYLFRQFFIFSEVNIFGGITSQYLNTDKKRIQNYNSFDFGFDFSFSEIDNVRFKFYTSNNYRIPNFTEIYYSKTFGNSTLIPEHFSQFSYSLLLNSTFTNFQISYFNILGKNKIVWIPTRLALQIPSNVKKIHSQGIELSIQNDFFNKLFTTNFIYVYTDAINISAVSSDDASYNKRLIYSPLHQIKFSLSTNWKDFSSTIFYQFVSDKFYTNDNNPIYKLPFYNLVNINIQYKTDIFDLKHLFSLSVNNLLNEDYLIIQSYPMPLRAIFFNYQMEIL